MFEPSPPVGFPTTFPVTLALAGAAFTAMLALSGTRSLVSMKVSVSLPEGDVEFLDAYARDQGIESRSAAVHQAVGLLRTAQLAAAYEDAWDAWNASGDAAAWDVTTADGLAP